MPPSYSPKMGEGLGTGLLRIILCRSALANGQGNKNKKTVRGRKFKR